MADTGATCRSQIPSAQNRIVGIVSKGIRDGNVGLPPSSTNSIPRFLPGHHLTLCGWPVLVSLESADGVNTFWFYF